MKKTLWLVIFCAIFSQVIGIFSGENIVKQLDHLLRQKRVINEAPYRNELLRQQKIPYIVIIQKNERIECGGIILTDEIILTAAHCFSEENAIYNVLIASINLGGRTKRNITKKIIFPHFNLNHLTDDLVLLFIYPPIDLVHSPNRRIEIHNGILPINTPATLSGWGCPHGRRTGLRIPIEVQSITVPVISLEECQSYYNNTRRITDKEICTLDRKGPKCATNSDSGGPLVVAGKLVGVYSWSGDKSRHENPDVFMNLLYPLYKKWIFANIRLNHGWF